MALFKISDSSLDSVPETTFQAEGIWERQGLQRLLRDSIETIAPDTMVLAEEYGDWEESRRRIDLLCLDKSARLVVVELKRTEGGGHMDLQAIRYAAMVSKMTFAAAIQAHRSYLQQRGLEGDADAAILEFLEWDEPHEEEFANDVRIVLASGEFSKELMTAVMWLTQYDIDIRCIRLKPYKLGDQVLLDVQQILPLPEAEDIWIKIREKEREERRARVQSRDFTRFDLTIGDQVFTNLPKRRLIFHVIREAVRRGNAPRQVMDSNRKWVAVLGEHDHDSFIARSVEHREPESSSSDIGRFFTEDDELMHWEGKTYALTKMWGLKTQEYVDQIIQELNLDNISYKETE